MVACCSRICYHHPTLEQRERENESTVDEIQNAIHIEQILENVVRIAYITISNDNKINMEIPFC